MATQQHRRPKRDRPGDRRYVFRPWITLRDGRRLYARDYGRSAWRIAVKEENGSDA